MTFDFNSHLDYHIKDLVEAVNDNQPIMQKLYDNPSTLSLEELYELRERLTSIEVSVTLLSNAHNVHLEDEKKAKRRRKLFRK